MSGTTVLDTLLGTAVLALLGGVAFAASHGDTRPSGLLGAAAEGSASAVETAPYEELELWVLQHFHGTGIDVEVQGDDRSAEIVLPEDLFELDDTDALFEALHTLEDGLTLLGWYAAIVPDEMSMSGGMYQLYPMHCYPVAAPSKVYHLTTPARADKALVEGLKLARGRRAHRHHYPSRVYVYRELPESAPWDLGLGDDYAMLEVDTTVVPDLKLCHDRQLDPNPSATEWEGAYSERPIPAAALRRIR